MKAIVYTCFIACGSIQPYWTVGQVGGSLTHAAPSAEQVQNITSEQLSRALIVGSPCDPFRSGSWTIRMVRNGLREKFEFILKDLRERIELVFTLGRASGDMSQGSMVVAPPLGLHCNSTIRILIMIRLYNVKGDLLYRFRRDSFAGMSMKKLEIFDANFAERDLSGCDFSKSFLAGTDFTSSNLTGASFVKSDLHEAKLVSACLVSADFSEADLSSADLSDTELTDTIFKNTIGNRKTKWPARFRKEPPAIGIVGPGRNLFRMNLRERFYYSFNFSGSRLDEADVSEASLEMCKFTGASMRGTQCLVTTFRGADLSGAILIRANLQGADLRGARLQESDFSDAAMKGAVYDEMTEASGETMDELVNKGALLIGPGVHLEGCDLRGVVLSNSDLRGASLRYADLRRADLSGANLEGANLEGAKLTGTLFRDALL